MNLPPIPPSATPAPKQKPRLLFMIISAFIAGIVYLYLFTPEWLSAVVRDTSPGCVFRKWTGIACPGCGGTRAARAVAEGDIIHAFQYNLLLPLAVLGLLLEYARLGIVAYTSYSDWRNKKWYQRYFIIFAWLVPVWFIVRNLLGI